MTPNHDTLRLVDEAIAHIDQALETLGRILNEGEQVITVDGITYELHGLAARLRSLRDDVAAEHDRPA